VHQTILILMLGPPLEELASSKPSLLLSTTDLIINTNTRTTTKHKPSFGMIHAFKPSSPPPNTMSRSVQNLRKPRKRQERLSVSNTMLYSLVFARLSLKRFRYV
jgi:hypothetical protein